MKFQIGAMTVGDILDRGLKLLLSRFGAFFAIQFLAFFPILLIQFAGLAVFLSNPTLGLVLAAIVPLILVLILQPIASGAVLKVIAEEYVGRKVTVGQALNFAVSRFGALLITSIMAGFVILLGIILLIVPGILWALSYAFVGQVVVLEQLSGGDALSRSSHLAAGHRGRIFGLLLLLVIINVILSLVAGLLQLVLPNAVYVQTEYGLMPTSFNIGNMMINSTVSFLLGVVVGSYGAVCMTLMYFDLRVRKEGFDLELAAQSGTTPAETR